MPDARDPVLEQRARIAAEHLMQAVIEDAMTSYGEANWRQDLAPAIVARLGVYFDYAGYLRRVMLVGPWEADPFADGKPGVRTARAGEEG